MALTLTSIFSTCVAASGNTSTDHGNVVIDERQFTVMTSTDGDDYLFVDGNPMGKITQDFDPKTGKAVLEGKNGEEIQLALDKHENVSVLVTEKGGDQHRGTIIVANDDHGSNDVMQDTVRAVEVVDKVRDGLDVAINSNQKVVIDDVEYAGQDLRDVANALANMTDREKLEFSKKYLANVKEVTLEDDKIHNNESNKVIEEDSRNKEISDEVNRRISVSEKKAIEQATIAYGSLDEKINNNTARIDNLEQDMKAMGNKMLDLEDRMDGVVATSHAVTNARPMVQDAGEFAMGVGIGAAGSKQALALGGAYQFNANWSSSVTVNYETAGKRSNSQVSAGAGVQYRFK